MSNLEDFDDDLIDLEDNAVDPMARRENESLKAHAAFLCYASISPARRSLTAAYGLYLERQGRPETGVKGAQNRQEKSISPPSHFRLWASEHSWLKRCEITDRHAQEEARRQYSAAIAATLEQARVTTERAGTIKHGFFNRVSRLVFARLDACELRDRRAAEDDAREDVQEENTGKRKRRILTPTPLSEISEICRVMRVACLVCDSGKADAFNSAQVKQVYDMLKESEREIEAQQEEY